VHEENRTPDPGQGAEHTPASEQEPEQRAGGGDELGVHLGVGLAPAAELEVRGDDVRGHPMGIGTAEGQDLPGHLLGRAHGAAPPLEQRAQARREVQREGGDDERLRPG
jgi:hypothetical protein